LVNNSNLDLNSVFKLHDLTSSSTLGINCGSIQVIWDFRSFDQIITSQKNLLKTKINYNICQVWKRKHKSFPCNGHTHQAEKPYWATYLADGRCLVQHREKVEAL
jgi:hypothetical protein